MIGRRAFYTRTGTIAADLISLLHLPYTAWHLSYVGIGAALAPQVNWTHLLGTLIAFFLGLGVGAHAFDEVRGRPLQTNLSDRALWLLGGGGMLGAGLVAVVGAVVISLEVLPWAAAGIALATGYSLEWSRLLHSRWGFAASWGAFPVLVGYWAQTQSLSIAALLAAGAAIPLSAAQRALSTPARYVRRETSGVSVTFQDQTAWGEAALLDTWERPLRLLSLAIPLLAIALLATHL